MLPVKARQSSLGVAYKAALSQRAVLSVCSPALLSAAGGKCCPERHVHRLNEADAGCEGNQTTQGNRHKQYYQNSEEFLFSFS